MQGKKFDTGKARWDLAPLDVFEAIVNVLGHGVEKYGEYNWQKVEDMDKRYFAALLRHITKHQTGELYDESGHLHLAHAGCNIIFLIWSLIHKHQIPVVKIEQKETL
jgi:hypothetical protein